MKDVAERLLILILGLVAVLLGCLVTGALIVLAQISNTEPPAQPPPPPIQIPMEPPPQMFIVPPKSDEMVRT